MKVHGNTTLQAGDLIGVKISGSGGEDDPLLTGRYLVSKLHHSFTRGDGLFKHELLMDCVRDTVQTRYPTQGVVCPDGGNSHEEIIPLGSADPGEVMF